MIRVYQCHRQIDRQTDEMTYHIIKYIKHSNKMVIK